MKIAKILDLREVIGDKPFLVVGDIHGMFDQLIELYNKSADGCGGYYPNLVSVGDLVDRGPASDNVMLFFYAFYKMSSQSVWSVQGNHENKFKRFCKGNKVKITHGLDKTIQQTKNMNLERLAKWIDSWPNIIRVPDVEGKPTYVVHAGIDGRYPIESQNRQTTMYIRGLDPRNYFDESQGLWYDTVPEDMNVICGHIIEEDWRPRPNIFALDGGCCHGGVLRGMLVKNGEYELLEVQGECHEPSDT